MFAPFKKLPYEIQLDVFHLAAEADYAPRIVWVYYKNGQLYTNQRPPALLHVCQLSRHVVQKFYKPWLPQFAGTLAHQPWGTLANKKNVERLSKLQNVYINMESDILLLSSKICRPGTLGEIERQILRNLAVEMDGYINFMNISKCARQCVGLTNLNLFEGESGRGQQTLFKAGRITEGIERLAKKKLRKTELAYTIPRVYSETIKSSKPESRRIESWYHYKYPKGYVAPKPSSHLDDRARLSELELDELEEASAIDLGGCYHTGTLTSQETTTKRKRYTLDVPQRSDAKPEKSAKTSHSSGPGRHASNNIALPNASGTRRARQLRTPPSSSPIHNKKSSQHNSPQPTLNYSYLDDDALSPRLSPSSSPEPERLRESINLPAYRPTRPQTPTPPQHDPFHEWIELDWEPLLQPSSPPDEFTTPYIEQFIDLPSSPIQSPYIDPRNIWGALEDVPESEPCILKDSGPGVTFADMARSKRALKPRVSDQVDGEEEERLLQLQLQAEVTNENQADSSTASTGAQGPLTPDSERSESSGVPKKIRAERQVENEIELLVQWENYPKEKDWTWELECELKQSLPKIVQAWKKTKNQEEAVLEHEVEKILGKRKWRGEPHYLVKWQGYEDIESRTWEPCDRLKVDVPEIVDEYESKGSKQKKGKARK